MNAARAEHLSAILQQIDNVKLQKMKEGQTEGFAGPSAKDWKSKFIEQVSPALASLSGNREVCEGIVYTVIKKLAEQEGVGVRKFHVVDPMAARFMPGRSCDPGCPACDAGGRRSQALSRVSNRACVVVMLSPSPRPRFH